MRTILTVIGCAALCVAVVVTLVGCGKAHIVDGPGMINPASWDCFTVSRSDSYAQHNFYITVEERNGSLYVTGEVRGEDGTIYTDEEGIRLSKKEANRIYDLNPAMLPDCQYDSTEMDTGEDSFFEEPIALDISSVNIEVVYTDGRTLEKIDENDFSIMVYEIVMPCFENKYQES